MKVEVEVSKKGRVSVHVMGMTVRQAEALVDVGAEADGIGKHVRSIIPEASKGKITRVLRDIGGAVNATLDLTYPPEVR